MSYMRDITGRRLDDMEVAEASTIALAIDNSNTNYVLTPYIYTPLPLYVAVPPSDHDVEISWGGTLAITAAGAGIIGLGFADTTSGELFEAGGNYRGDDFIAGTYSAQAGSFTGAQPVGSSATWRTYQMIGACFPDPGEPLAALMTASSNGAGMAGNRSAFLKAVYLS